MELYETLPIVPLRDLVVFPHMMVPFVIGRPASIRALEHALDVRARRVLLVTDGYVGAASDELARAVARRGLEVRVLLTPGGWRRDLAPLAARIEELPARDARGRRTA